MTEQLALTLTAASVGFVSAIFFCIGNAFNSVSKITLQSTQFWDFSEPVARSLASQRAQYLVGGLLLLTSFSLQILAALASSTIHATLPQYLNTWPYLVCAVLLPTFFVSCVACWSINLFTINIVLRCHQERLVEQELKSKED